VPRFSIRFACFLVLGTLFYTAFSNYYIEALPMGMLALGVGGVMHFSSDIVEIIPAINRAARRSALEQWNGRYYTFMGTQIRLCLLDETVWIVEADVRKIISPAVSEREKRLLGADHAPIPGTTLHAYSEHGLVRLMKVRLIRRGGETDMKKFIVWLQNEAIPNVRRFPTSSFT
jgi:hypothetical protein